MRADINDMPTYRSPRTPAGPGARPARNTYHATPQTSTRTTRQRTEPNPMGNTGPRRKETTIVRAFLATVLLLSTTLLLVMIWPSELGGRALWATVAGQSMEPNYYAGDLLLTWNTGTWNHGDVVLYRPSQGAPNLIVHRLKSRNPNGTWIAQGDNNLAPDPYPIPSDAILSEEVLRLPRGGLILETLKGTTGLLLLTGAFATWVLLAIRKHHQRRTRARPQAAARLGNYPGVLLDISPKGALFALTDCPHEPTGTIQVTVWARHDPTGTPMRGTLSVTRTRRKQRQLLIRGPLTWDPNDLPHATEIFPAQQPTPD